METQDTLENIRSLTVSLIDKAVNLRTIGIFLIAISAAYLLSQLLAYVTTKIVKRISLAGDQAASTSRSMRLRRLETYLSISLALMRFFVFLIAILVAWQYSNPSTALFGFASASVVFIVLAGATISPMLRDLTSGSIMIAEQWYTVGDYVQILPFGNVDGVVERMNLRSTKIRNIDGEVIWLHNQHIQGVKVTPGGVRTIAIDVFVNSLEKGKAMVTHVSQTLPVDPTMLAAPLSLTHNKKLGPRLWHITAVGQTAPGREWLLTEFARSAMEEFSKKDGSIIVHGPIARTADETAKRRFRRAVRIQKAATPS